MGKVLCIKCGKEFDFDISKSHMFEIYSKLGCPNCSEVEEVIFRCFNEEVYIRINSQEQWNRFIERYRFTLRWDARHFEAYDYSEGCTSLIYEPKWGAKGFFRRDWTKDNGEPFEGKILVDWVG